MFAIIASIILILGINSSNLVIKAQSPTYEVKVSYTLDYYYAKPKIAVEVTSNLIVDDTVKVQIIQYRKEKIEKTYPEDSSLFRYRYFNVYRVDYFDDSEPRYFVVNVKIPSDKINPVRQFVFSGYGFFKQSYEIDQDNFLFNFPSSVDMTSNGTIYNQEAIDFTEILNTQNLVVGNKLSFKNWGYTYQVSGNNGNASMEHAEICFDKGFSNSTFTYDQEKGYCMPLKVKYENKQYNFSLADKYYYDKIENKYHTSNSNNNYTYTENLRFDQDGEIYATLKIDKIGANNLSFTYKFKLFPKNQFNASDYISSNCSQKQFCIEKPHLPLDLSNYNVYKIGE